VAGVFVATRILVTRLEGRVDRQRPGEAEWTQIRLVDDYGRVDGSTLLKPGDSVRTGPDGLVEMLLHKDVWLRLAASGELVLAEGAAAEATVEVKAGDLQQRVAGKPRGQPYAVKSPTTVCGVKGTRFAVRVRAGAERVVVADGTVDLGATLGEVRAGKAVQWSAKKEPVREDLTPAEHEDLSSEILVPPPMDMVLVPAGKYRIGGDVTRPPHDVELSDFLVDRRETSNAEYAIFVKATRAEAPRGFVGGRAPAGRERHPCHGLTWRQARDYIRWCGKDLPTEAQWEAAARGPKGTTYSWGNRAAPLDWRLPTAERLQNVDVATPDVSWAGCEAMGSGAPEWCADWYVIDPTPPKEKDPKGPERSTTRVVRGHEPEAAKRKGEPPEDEAAGARGAMEMR
jgi:formylglycine-generating enzyme required for sulfatase activity